MNVIITAGGTTENIDMVRSITNISTGSLGCHIAEVLSKHSKVYFTGSKVAINLLKSRGLANPEDVELIPVTNTRSVEIVLHNLLTTKNIDAVVHAMAVSDYSVDAVYSMEDIVEIIKNNNLTKEEIVDLISNPTKIDNTSKISSSSEFMDVRLRKTPKLIDMMKQLSPKTKLIGFKLLNNVPHEELISVARESLNRTQADYIIANDLKNVSENNHIAYVVDKTSTEKVEGKMNIAIKISELLKHTV